MHDFSRCGLRSIKRLLGSSVQSFYMVISGLRPTKSESCAGICFQMDHNVQSAHAFLSTTDNPVFPWPLGGLLTAMCFSHVIKAPKMVLSIQPSCLHLMSAPLGDDPSSASSTCRITQRMLQVLFASATNDGCNLRFLTATFST